MRQRAPQPRTKRRNGMAPRKRLCDGTGFQSFFTPHLSGVFARSVCTVCTPRRAMNARRAKTCQYSTNAAAEHIRLVFWKSDEIIPPPRRGLRPFPPIIDCIRKCTQLEGDTWMYSVPRPEWLIIRAGIAVDSAVQSAEIIEILIGRCRCGRPGDLAWKMGVKPAAKARRGGNCANRRSVSAGHRPNSIYPRSGVEWTGGGS